MALSTILKTILRATKTSALDLSTAQDPLVVDLSDTLATGTGLDQADQMWHDQRTLNASTSEELDLAGVLTGPFGDTITFARIKGIIIRNRTTTAGYTLKVGGAASNQFVTPFADSSDKLIVRPGGFILLWGPDATAYVVTAGTGDKLKIDNANAGAVIYDIILIGATA